MLITDITIKKYYTLISMLLNNSFLYYSNLQSLSNISNNLSK